MTSSLPPALHIYADEVDVLVGQSLGAGAARRPSEQAQERAPLALQAHKSNPRSKPLLALPERGERYPCE